MYLYRSFNEAEKDKWVRRNMDGIFMCVFFSSL